MWTKTIISRYTNCCDKLGKRFMVIGTRFSQQISSAPLPNLDYSDDLFKYTRGRFVCNEEYEMLQRQVYFNFNELARCAAEAIGAESCTAVESTLTGCTTKVFIYKRSFDGTFTDKWSARNILGIYVPKVLAWSSKAEENLVGAEYIIMEKVQGIELEHVCPSMNIKGTLAVVKTIADFQKAWTAISCKKIGSLYYAKDLDEAHGVGPLYTDTRGTDITDARFDVGPSTGREYFDDGRTNINFDRGPWSSLKQYHAVVGQRETACVRRLPRLPKSPITLHGLGTYQPTREKKLKALDCYLKLIEFILPEDPAISSAHLWHGDLHVANILVNPSKPTEVVGLIDWQSTEISPLHFHARQPHIIDYDGPPVYGLERPQPPNNTEELHENAKKQAETLYLQQPLCALYNTLIHRQNPQLHAALQFQQTTSYSLLLLARNILIDGEATYLAQVAKLQATWDTLPGAKGPIYPFSFSTREREEIESDVKGVVLGMEAMSSVRESIGEMFPEQGIVKPDKYEEALDALGQIKDQVIDEFAKTEHDRTMWQKMWPFET